MGEAIAMSGYEEEEATAKGSMKWEKFMPRMVMRVLLVEADDSTRQVIAALLRKCGYRVAAVSDGLKAWELLKGTPYNVDLILTEAELPSISGFALLTLAMEHDVCKNIPFIMMSSQDSVGTVYKCMMKGAADYLVKPIRRNELQNLWQHVWRRRSLPVYGNWPEDESAAVQNGEPEAENDAASNKKQDSTTCNQADEDMIERGSDVQSSCTGSDLDPLALKEQHLKWSSMHKYPSGLALSSCKFGLTLSLSKEASTRKEQVATEGTGDNHLTADPFTKTIDLIGIFDDGTQQHNGADYSSRHSAGDLNLSMNLNLSLERSDPNDHENLGMEERLYLKQSSASAFSRYINNSLQLPEKRYKRSEREAHHAINDSSPETPSPSLSTPKSIVSLLTSSSNQAEHLLPFQRQYPASVPVKVVRANIPSSELAITSPSAEAHQDPSLHQLNPSKNLRRETSEKPTTSYPNNQNMGNGEVVSRPKHDALEDRRHCSLSGDRSATSSFASESLSPLNSMDRGNNGENGAKVNMWNDDSAGGTLDGGVSQQSLQREAALVKFRLKRKNRCFEKKVRYESRKKLAEQRPRVKGQFVRQTTNIDVCTEKR